MLRERQIDHFRTFGFLVLPAYLGEGEAASLGVEVDRALREAYGACFDERPSTGGIEGPYLPMMGERTPISRGLVEDPRFLGAAERLMGAPVLPNHTEGILYFGPAGLHADDGIGVRGVKFVTYLQPLRAGTGALRLLPGSHHPECGVALSGWGRRHPVRDAEELRRHLDDMPCFVAETDPGDVIAFDLHTWHASVGGRDRYQWAIAYPADPTTAEEEDRVRWWVADMQEPTDEPYGGPAYPLYNERWLVPDPERPVRARMTRRMRELGFFQPGGKRRGTR